MCPQGALQHPNCGPSLFSKQIKNKSTYLHRTRETGVWWDKECLISNADPLRPQEALQHQICGPSCSLNRSKTKAPFEGHSGVTVTPPPHSKNVLGSIPGKDTVGTV